MPSKTFTPDASGRDTITLNWGLLWRDFTVAYNGQEIGQLSSGAAKALQQGTEFTLPDGRPLRVQLTRKYLFSQGLDVWLDGQQLAGSHTEPRQQIKQALYVFYFLIAVNVGVGLLALLPGMEFLQSLGLGWASILTGAVYAGLAYWAKTKTSALAFYCALALFAVDYILSLAMMTEAGGTGVNPGAGIVVRLFLGILLYSGAQGAKTLRAQQLASA